MNNTSKIKDNTTNIKLLSVLLFSGVGVFGMYTDYTPAIPTSGSSSDTSPVSRKKKSKSEIKSQNRRAQRHQDSLQPLSPGEGSSAAPLTPQRRASSFPFISTSAGQSIIGSAPQAPDDHFDGPRPLPPTPPPSVKGLGKGSPSRVFDPTLGATEKGLSVRKTNSDSSQGSASSSGSKFGVLGDAFHSGISIIAKATVAMLDVTIGTKDNIADKIDGTSRLPDSSTEKKSPRQPEAEPEVNLEPKELFPSHSSILDDSLPAQGYFQAHSSTAEKPEGSTPLDTEHHEADARSTPTPSTETAPSTTPPPSPEASSVGRTGMTSEEETKDEEAEAKQLMFVYKGPKFKEEKLIKEIKKRYTEQRIAEKKAKAEEARTVAKEARRERIAQKRAAEAEAKAAEVKAAEVKAAEVKAAEERRRSAPIIGTPRTTPPGTPVSTPPGTPVSTPPVNTKTIDGSDVIKRKNISSDSDLDMPVSKTNKNMLSNEANEERSAIHFFDSVKQFIKALLSVQKISSM